MSTQNEIAELLRLGIEAAREGNKAKAREYFENVVELDENNEKGWFWLASVVETDEERRICLSNVLHINPSNERARAALDAIETNERERVAAEEVVPGVTRRQLTAILGIGVLVVIGLVIGLLLISINNSNQQRAAADATAAAVIAATQSVIEATASSEAATATQFALATPTATVSPTPNIPTLPPTWTPSPGPTATATVEVLPAPVGLQGLLSAWSGRDIRSNGFLPVGYFSLDFGGGFTPIGNETGRDVSFFVNGQRVVYTRYDDLLIGTTIEAVNLNGTQVDALPERWRGAGILEPKMPDYAPDGQSIVFVARDQAEQVGQLFILSLQPTPEGVSPLRRVTNDSAAYSYPRFSPDGTRIVAIRNDISGVNPGEDIVTVDVATGGVVPVTNDLGATIEMGPRWTSDGTQIVYAAALATDPNNHDIAIRNANGTGTPLLLVRDASDDLYPVISPDGRNLAFASNRAGNYNIYIMDVATQALSQLTSNPENDFPGDWWIP